MRTAEEIQLIELSISAIEKKIIQLEEYIKIANKLGTKGIYKSIIELDLHIFDDQIRKMVQEEILIDQIAFKKACHRILEGQVTTLGNMRNLLGEKA